MWIIDFVPARWYKNRYELHLKLVTFIIAKQKAPSWTNAPPNIKIIYREYIYIEQETKVSWNSYPTKKPAKWSNITESTTAPNSLESMDLALSTREEADDDDAAKEDFRRMTFSENTLESTKKAALWEWHQG